MSVVVLRCPACGTTQGQPGECDACHEGDVRYFCTNHTPGRWLDEPTCDGCGARFGVAAPARPKPRSPAPTHPRRAPAPAEPEAPASTPRVPWPPRPRRRGPRPPVEEPVGSPEPTLADLLERLAESERHRPVEVLWEPTVAAPRKGLPIMGCIVRFVLFIMLLIGLGLSGFFF